MIEFVYRVYIYYISARIVSEAVKVLEKTKHFLYTYLPTYVIIITKRYTTIDGYIFRRHFLFKNSADLNIIRSDSMHCRLSIIIIDYNYFESVGPMDNL